MALLGLGPDDWAVAVEVVRQAVKLKQERDTALIDVLSEATARRTIRELGRAMK